MKLIIKEMEDIRRKVDFAVAKALDGGLTNAEVTYKDIADEVICALDAEESIRTTVEDVINEVFYNIEDVRHSDVVDWIAVALNIESMKVPF